MSVHTLRLYFEEKCKSLIFSSKAYDQPNNESCQGTLKVLGQLHEISEKGYWRIAHIPAQDNNTLDISGFRKSMKEVGD
ncbi:hypothetical protein [Peribacillus sp. NPDC096540]|uniref:hypothetical protein n=1 Tax=Peribacillus sp. NPDC096540 TaxID=3390612 RepID=UPI003D0278B4